MGTCTGRLGWALLQGGLPGCHVGTLLEGRAAWTYVRLLGLLAATGPVLCTAWLLYAASGCESRPYHSDGRRCVVLPGPSSG